MHEDKLFEICVGLLISPCESFCEVISSIFLPSLLVWSLLYLLKKGSFKVEYLKLTQNCQQTVQNHHMIG